MKAGVSKTSAILRQRSIYDRHGSMPTLSLFLLSALSDCSVLNNVIISYVNNTLRK